MVIRIILLFSLFSCSFNNIEYMNKKKEKEESPINVLTKSIYSYDDQIFNISVDYRTSYNNFVFYKKDESFQSSLLVITQIYDSINDSIVIQESWPIDINIPHDRYKETKSKEKYILFTKEKIKLSKGVYDLIINVKDLDNNHLLKYKEVLSLNALEGFGDVTLISGDKDIESKLDIDSEQLTFEFQFFNPIDSDNSKIDLLTLSILNNDNNYQETFTDLYRDGDLYKIYFSIPEGYYGELECKLTLGEYSKERKFILYNSNAVLWSNDVNEVVGVMRYIYTPSEMREMKNLNDKEKIDLIVDYWKQKDPNEETEENELLQELTKRFHFVNDNLSDMSGNGWSTDRGEIYITYGKPFSVEKYTNKNNEVFEIWKYSSGEEFLFEDNKFGSFVLVRRSIG